MLPRTGLLHVCAERWKYEIGVFVTGSVNGVELATYSITMYVIVSGFAVIASCSFLGTHNVFLTVGTFWYWNSCGNEGEDDT